MCAHHVPLLVMVVLDDEDHVKAGQDGGHEVDVVLPFGVVPAAEHRVGSGQHGAARVQGGGDSSLRGVWDVSVGQWAPAKTASPAQDCYSTYTAEGHTKRKRKVIFFYSERPFIF